MAILIGSDWYDTIFGTADADVIYGLRGGDNLYGNAGDDIIFGNEGKDTIFGDAGNDILVAGVEDGTAMYGGAGDDVLFASKPDPDPESRPDSYTYLNGGSGDDVLVAYASPNGFDGGDGNDIFHIGKNYGGFSGGAGADIFIFSPADHDPGPDSRRAIRDFEPGVDKIRIGGAGIEFADLSIEESHSHVEITWEGNAIPISLDHDSHTGLVVSADDFEFVDESEASAPPVPPDSTVPEGVAPIIPYDDSGTDSMAAETTSPVMLHGNPGPDILTGGAADDALWGGAGDDELWGGGGNDMLEGGPGADRFNGGRGRDTVSYAASSKGVVVRLHSLSAKGGDASGDTFPSLLDLYYTDASGARQVASLPDIENLVGSDHNDVLAGDRRDNSLEGGAGDDVLYGGPGGGDDVLWGGAGNDRIYGGLGNDQLFAEAGDDLLRGGAGADDLDGGAGNDVLTGGAGADNFLFRIDSGTDTITDFSPGIDKIILWDGQEIAEYTIDSYQLEPGATFDISYDPVTEEDIFTTTGLLSLAATVRLSDGSVIKLTAGAFTGTIREGELFVRNGNDYLDGSIADDVLYGGAGSDKIDGRAGNDHLDGGAGGDHLTGGHGNDILTGGSGNDRLAGGPGNDSLMGGAGDDVFVFGIGDGHDQILDFTLGEDKILLNDGLLFYWDVTAVGELEIVQNEADYSRATLTASNLSEAQVNIHFHYHEDLLLVVNIEPVVGTIVLELPDDMYGYI
ncbi:MAG: calcium-binding protein [Gammaproteobacteria bacterium]|nr:calcium-binding protein [Gammaproteobacteria bacterium]